MSDSGSLAPVTEESSLTPQSTEERIRDLEAQVSAKESELKAKTASYEEQLSKEHAKQREKENHHAAKREDQNQEILKLTNERTTLNDKVKKLVEREIELELVNAQLTERKKEIAKIRAQHSEDTTNLQFQLDDKVSVGNKQHQELSDLRCQLSILEHKLGHASSKQSAAEAQMDELTKLQLQVQTLNERLSANERVQSTEAARAQRERRGLEEKVNKLTAELDSERLPPTKTQVVERYETVLQAKHDLLHEAIQLATRPGGPLPPLRGAETEHPETVQAFLDKLKVFLMEHQQNGSAPSSPTTPPGLGAGAATPKLRRGESEFKRLNEALERVPHPTRGKLIKRFEDCAQANIASSRRFGDTSGFPDQGSEEPAVLVNHIANLTVERDHLQNSVDDLTLRLLQKSDKESAGGGFSHRRTNSGASGSPNNMTRSPTSATHSPPQIIKISVAAPSYQSPTTASRQQQRRGTTPTGSTSSRSPDTNSARKRLSMQ